MSHEEQSALEILASDVERMMPVVERLIPIPKLVVSLIFGAFAVGTWAAGLQIKAINQDKDIIELQKRMSAVERSTYRTDRNVVKIGQALKLDVELPKD